VGDGVTDLADIGIKNLPLETGEALGAEADGSYQNNQCGQRQSHGVRSDGADGAKREHAPSGICVSLWRNAIEL
jgi:hypothetical protein